MTTYAQIKTDVDKWLIRDDIAADTNAFDSITNIAQADINRRIRTVAQEAHTVLSLTGRSIAAPALFMEVKYMQLDDAASPSAGTLEYKAPEMLRRDNTYQNAARTSFYTIEGDGSNAVQFTFAPEGNATTPPQIALGYYTRFATLVADVDTNWLLANHYDIYLYAYLRAGAEFIQEDILEERFAAKFEAMVASLHKSEQRKRQRFGSMVAYGNPRGVV